MWAPESSSRSGAEVSGASWPPPGAASEAGGGMSAGVVCTGEGLALAELAAPMSVDRDTAGDGIGERTEDAL